MEAKVNRYRMIYFFGVVALLFGALDPMEGSVVITAGSMLIAVSTYKMIDRHWKVFLASFIMIIVGVFFLFYLSSLGGFGGNSNLSWWWGSLIIPYPVGWVTSIIYLIIRAVQHKKHKGGG